MDSEKANRFLFDRKITIFWIIFLLTGIFHGVTLYFSKSVYHGVLFINYPLHATLESTGSLIGILVACLVHFQKGFINKVSFSETIVSALLCMALLDLVHALYHAGNEFVWFHSLATFFGGILFSFVLFPRSWQLKISKPFFLTSFVILFVILCIMFPNYIPTMVIKGQFTFPAIFLNLFGGLLMLASGVRLYINYRKTRELDDILFVLHCVFFGLAAIMFQESSLWDIAWWGWHTLRFLAYLTAFLFALHSLFSINAKIIESTKLNQLIDNLQRSNEELAQFAYRTSHDLKSPLVSITRLADFICCDIDNNNYTEVKDNIGKIKAKALQLNVLVSDILTLTKIDYLEDKIEKYYVKKTVQSIWDDLEALRQDYDCQLIMDIQEPYFICSSVIKLTQVLENLISNAIKYSDQTQAISFVKVSLKKAEPHIIIFVEDNGIGIPRKHHQDVFKMFKRFNTKVGFGTGLGLAMVEKYIISMNGDINFISTSEGTRFIIKLPILQGEKNE